MRIAQIAPLAERFLAVACKQLDQSQVPVLAPEALALLEAYAWPGNVRELANIVERLSIVHAGRTVTDTDVAAVLPVDRASRARTTPLPDPASLEHSLCDTLDEYERVLISRALSMASGNVAEAAEFVSSHATARDSGRQRVSARHLSLE